MQASRLNLLSKEKKHHLQQLVYVQFSKYMLEIILFIVCVFGVALLGSEHILQSYFQSIHAQRLPNIQQLETINEKITYINTTVQQAEIIQSLNTSWTNYMTTLADNTPNGVRFTGVRMVKSGKLLQVDGQALNREALLAFQQNLEAIEWINEANIPISQLTEKENIPFSIQATLK